jgi:hypothetical protein
MKILSKAFVRVWIVSLTLFSSCDLVEEVTDCVNQFAEYTERLQDYQDIEGEVCDNQAAVQEFIDFLETEAKGSCIEETLEDQDQDLDQIIQGVKDELANCN